MYIANFVRLQFEVLQNHTFSCTKHPLLLKGGAYPAHAWLLGSHISAAVCSRNMQQVSKDRAS